MPQRVGNNGDDILIAGLTRKDERDSTNHEAFWGALLNEWNDRYRSFSERTTKLRNTLLAEVVDDLFADSVDILTGAAGDDWLIFQAGEDKVSGKSELSN